MILGEVLMECIKSFCQRLDIKCCEELVPFYEEGAELFKEQGYAVIDKERLIKLNNKLVFLEDGLKMFWRQQMP